MYASLTFLAISLFTVVHPAVLDEDMLLYWRRIKKQKRWRDEPDAFNKDWSSLAQDRTAWKSRAMPLPSSGMILANSNSESSKCKPFTSYFISCNKCVCSAEGTAFCTRMACFKKPRFTIPDESKEISPVDQPDDDDDSSKDAI